MPHRRYPTRFQEQLEDRCSELIDDQYNYDTDIKKYIDEVVPDTKLWYKGCLQEKYYIDNIHDCRNFTAASYCIYRLNELPPKKLQYPGWEKQQVIYMETIKLTMPQFWIVCCQRAVPKQLQIDGWWEQEFIYDVLQCCENKTMNVADTMCLYGTMKDAYEYYDITINTQKYDKYKISDKGYCEICYQQNVQIYNFCKNQHNGGICLKCYQNLMTNKCPLCRGKLLLNEGKHLSVETIY